MDPAPDLISFRLDGQQVAVHVGTAETLLDALRGPLGLITAKDGCSPQGQCGCCTLLVDGEPRVACVTPIRRVRDRDVTTIDGLERVIRDQWSEALCATGGSQCGFCTPGIVMRLEWVRRRGSLHDDDSVGRALAAHLCRCTGWQTIREAAAVMPRSRSDDRDLDAASERATIEGGTPQTVSPSVCLGGAGFADDTVPPDALVAVLKEDGEWMVASSAMAAREAATKVQGRRTTIDPAPPIDLPPGEWDLTLRTCWVEPAYLEVDVAWCIPGREPSTVLANGGAFGGKRTSPLPEVARRLATEHGQPVVVRWSREDAVRLGPKRPPMAVGMRADGSGVMRVARTPGIVAVVEAFAPGLHVEEVDVVGPPTSADVRAAGWAEAAVLLSALSGDPWVVSPAGARAMATVDNAGIRVAVRCGRPLDDVVLRSYCIGAAHMAYGWVTSEGLAVDAEGVVQDLTIRSFGIVRANDMPNVTVDIEPDDGEPVCGSDAVFAAVAAALWRASGRPPEWPTGVASRP